MDRVSSSRIVVALAAVVSCALALVLALALGASPALADEAEVVANGTSGTCTWALDSEGTLTISPKDGESGVLATIGAGPWYSYRESIVEVVIEDGVSAGEKTRRMFANCTNLVSVSGIENLVTSSTTDVSYMFYGCSSLTSLDISGWDVSGVEDMDCMFYGCSSLVSLDLSGWDVSNVTDMGLMFYGCSSLVSLDLSGWDVSGVTTWPVPSLLSGCTGLRTVVVDADDGSNDTSTLVDSLPDPESDEYGTGYWVESTSGTTVTLTAAFYTSVEDAEIELSSTRYVYDGEAKEPSVTVEIADAGRTLTEGVDYTVEYANNVEAGTATVTVTGTGDYDGAVTVEFEIVPDPSESGTCSAYSYEVYYLDGYGDTWYSGCTRALYIKTDNPDSSSISLAVVSGEATISLPTGNYYDIDYTADDSGSRLRAVEGGYVVTVKFMAEDGTRNISGDVVVGVYEDGADTGLRLSLTVLDYDEVRDAWIDEVIAAYTTDDMDSFEKLDAICYVLRANGRYLLNDGTYIIHSAASPQAPCFLSLVMDSSSAPTLVALIAERIGGFDEIDNLYDNYSRGTSEWSRYHAYVSCTIGDETRLYSICKSASTGYVDLDEVEYIDLSDTGSLTLALMWAEEAEHSYVAETTAEPTCTEGGAVTYTCSRCGDSYEEAVEALGHTAGGAATENVVAATCTEEGSYDVVVRCSACGEELSRMTVAVPAAGHSYVAVVTGPTSTEAGYTTYTCSRCGDSYTVEGEPATGDGEDEEGDDGADDVGSAAAPDGTDASDGSDSTDGDAGSEDDDEASSEDAEDVAEEDEASSRSFEDVQDSSKYYYAPVYAVADAGIMTGLGDGTAFGVGKSLNRQQMVVVLYRIFATEEEQEVYGSTTDSSQYAANETPLTDVADYAYYTAAVNWAYATGVTTGYGDGATFGVGDACTFQQFCTFLARAICGGDAALEAAVTDAEAEAALAAFSDASSVSSYARKAIAYLCGVEYTDGKYVVEGKSDGTVAPGESVKRERAATVVYRLMEAGLIG